MTRTLTCILALAAGTAAAQEAIVTEFDGTFDDATFAVESAIVGKGLVIDFVSHVGEMLNRTGGDVGASEMLFDNADVFLFCSAVVSRQVMEADPMNIVHCPYNIFVAEMDGKVMIGHRDYPDGTMQPVEDMLQEIVAEAAGL